MSHAGKIIAISDHTFEGRAIRLATAGYSAAPEGYEAATFAFLDALINELGGANVGLVTSPTADAGSIDAISTLAAQRRRWGRPRSLRDIASLGQGVPLLYVTAQDYVDYINPDKFPPTLRRTAYLRAPKFVFPDAATYSRATALASNALLVTGGRDTTVSDFVNAVKQGNKVVILDNPVLGEVDWNEAKQRPNNGARYLVEQLEAFRRGEPLPYPGIKGFDEEFLEEYEEALEENVRIVTVPESGDIRQAVREAAEHLHS